MNLYDLNSDIITMLIDGKDMEMKPAICYDKVYDKWLVSRYGKLWSVSQKRFLKGSKSYTSTTRTGNKHKSRRLLGMQYDMMLDEEDWWGDGSGRKVYKEEYNSRQWTRPISAHKIIMDTWAPIYDNPPVGIVWEEWEKVRDLPSIFNHISKTVWIDHIDDDPANNHIDNLRRVTAWDNNSVRKAGGI